MLYLNLLRPIIVKSIKCHVLTVKKNKHTGFLKEFIDEILKGTHMLSVIAMFIYLCVEALMMCLHSPSKNQKNLSFE